MTEIPEDIAAEVLGTTQNEIRELLKLRTQEVLARRQAAKDVENAGSELAERAAKLTQLLADPTSSRTMMEDELRRAIAAGKRMKR